MRVDLFECVQRLTYDCMRRRARPAADPLRTLRDKVPYNTTCLRQWFALPFRPRASPQAGMSPALHSYSKVLVSQNIARGQPLTRDCTSAHADGRHMVACDAWSVAVDAANSGHGRHERVHHAVLRTVYCTLHTHSTCGTAMMNWW